MVRRQEFPETIRRHYWDRAEYGRDEAALLALGYMPVQKDVNDPLVSSPTIPAATNGLFGNLDRTVQRRVPAIHVLYRRRPA
jgi:hypothetical protein